MKRSLPHLAAVVTLTALLSACNRSSSEADLLKTARKAVEGGEVKAAIIDLKNILQKNAQSGEARYLLGRALLESGDSVAAAVELQKAADLKFSVAEVVPPLARALLARGESRKVIDGYAGLELPDAAAQADLQTSLAVAHARLGEKDKANEWLSKALASRADYAPALLLQARMAADAGDFAVSAKALDAVLARDQKNAEAWKLRGDIALHSTKDRKAALEAYRKAVEGKSSLVAAQTAIVEILIADKDISAATKQVAEMKKVLPNHPQTTYFEGVLAYIAKDFATTRERAGKLVQLAPNNALALQLAGSAEYQLRSFHQAETYLTKALQQAPGLPLARMMLAQIQVRTGQPTKAIETLAPVLEQPNVPPEMLAIAAEAYLQNGDAKKSEELYARASKARPDDPKLRAARAMGQLRQPGKGESAMGELENIAAGDTGTVADMALVAAHLRRNELDAALKAIDGLEKKQPDKPMAANLRGRVLVMKKDAAGARASFERALSIDKRYYPAVASLAALDLSENKPADARNRFEAYLKEEPKHVGALQGLAVLLQRAGAPGNEVSDVLTRAVKAEPSQPGPRLRLIEYQLQQRDHKAALATAQDGLAAMPNHPDLLQALGRVQMTMGDTQQAITTLNKLVAVKGDAPAVHLALGEVFFLRKEYSDAEKSFRRALSLRPDLLQAQRALVATLVADRRHADALTVAKEVQKQRPDGAGQQLEGDIEGSRKNWDAAANAYRASLAKTPATETAVRLHGLLASSGKTVDADKFASEWEKGHPKDAAFLFYRADLALNARELALAESRYRAVVQIQPGNALALNNIAWLLVQQNKPGGIDFAMKATQLMPNQPALLDTLSMAQAADNNPKEAVETQKKAVALAPQDNMLRFNLAKLLVQAGDKTGARVELQTLEKLGTKFPEHQKVGELLKSVSS